MTEVIRPETSTLQQRQTFIVTAVIAFLFISAALVYHWDVPLSDYLRQCGFTRTTMGRAYQMLGKADVVILLMLFVAWLCGDRLFFWRFIVAAASSGIMVTVLKFAVGRQRPGGSSRFNSFPSGDSQTAFVWAVMIAHQFPAIAVPVLFASSAVALFRVTHGAHYPSDILFGSALGIAGAFIAIRTIDRAPRFLYHIINRSRRFWLIPAVVAIYIMFYAVLQKPEVLISAAILVPLSICGIAYTKRDMITRFRRMKGR